MPNKLPSKNTKSGGLDPAALDKVEVLINNTFHGSITFIVQDGCVIQIERNEKIRIADLLHNLSVVKTVNDISKIRAKIVESTNGLKYGQVVVVIKNGAVVQIDKTEKSRFTSWEGMDGEGI
ncbi:hypothetical protein SDC9_13789 [bioreactor metagenome]|uniref:DUF2292 domain-containing protein n=1 Tax=bioreactor metagenome TaxID=1076179 RepID=A0A644TM85_9ZZZZ|nr:YezD family protein [Negativicutes bacterium]